MITAKITVTTKKNTETQTTWGIVQIRPYPDFECRYGHKIERRNAGGLLPDCNGRKEGLPEVYNVALLRSDKTPDNMNDRTAHAGYVPYASYGQKPEPPNPGSFAYRGNDLGEVTAEITPSFGGGYYFRWSVRGYGSNATPAERAFLDEQVKPGILKAIEEHRAALKAEAVAKIRAWVAEICAEMRASVDAAEKEMEKAIAEL